MKAPSTFRLRVWIVIAAVLVAGLPVSYYVARHYAWPAYKSWRQAKLERMTHTFMAAKDYDNALLTARQALRDNQRNVALWKLAAAAAKAKGKPDVIYYQQNVAKLDKSLESQFELIRLALQFDDFRDAVEAVESVKKPSATQNAEFHALAARAYLGLNRPTVAKLHLDSLVGLRPDDAKARLDLAEINLAEDAKRTNTALRDEILKLSGSPGLKERALEILLRDALAGGEKHRAVELATMLREAPRLTGEQRVLVLAGLAEGPEGAAADYRHQLQADFINDPPGVVALAKYYRSAGFSTEARKWFDTLPENVRKDLAVQEAVAGAYLEWGEWARLDQALSGTQWKEREFMRHAFTAYSARKNGRMADAGNAWRLAVIQAGDNVRKTSELLTLVGRWGWQGEQYDLVWKLFALMPRNEAISRQLIAWEHYQGHTSNLNRIYARLVEFSSEDRMLKNNLAYSSLLLDANLSKAYEIARLNYKADPSNPFFITTQAFALYKQNKPAEALALMNEMRPAALSAPERSLYLALYRAANGDAAGAGDLLAGLKSAKFLPEERRLIAKAASDIAKLKGEQGEGSRIYAMDNRGEIDRSKGWLRSLPGEVRGGVTPEMQTSDSLFAMGDQRGLAAQLRKGGWNENEHLRLALIAYVSRARSDESAAKSYWRTAVGSVTGDEQKLKELSSLAAAWNWRAESMETLGRIYEINPSNTATFTELMNYYRAAGRTSELVTVLNAYISAHPNDQAQRCGFAYYSMLSGVNVSRAYVTAQESFNAAPNDPLRRMVYAFALWKQRRPQEAWELLEKASDEQEAIVPTALLRAAVLADMERRDDAAAALKTFDRTRALPEESTLATLVASKLKTDRRTLGLN